MEKDDEAYEYYKKGSVLLDDDAKYNLAILNGKKKDNKSTVSLYKQLYKSGHMKGCFNLGMIMEINDNLEDAEKYYKKSADRDDVKSEYRLAYVYDRKEELGDAIYYYEKAIEKNHTLSKYRLANLYNRENEIEKAKTYYKMAAEDDITEAKNNLAGIYFEEKDYENAIKYYEDAIVVGCKSSLENLGDLYYQNQDIEKAISYYSRIPNNVSCQIKLGNIYEDLNNIEEAISWYKKASENGDTRSSYRLGCIYESLGNTKNARKYFEMASSKNHMNARIHLGRIYFREGKLEESKMMFDTPANENNVYAQHMVGLIYDMFYKDYVNSKFWYEKARAQGCVESIYNLGQIYLKLNDDAEVEKYYKEGIKYGSKKCEYMLAGLYYKKSLDMYISLANEEYDNCEEIVEGFPNLNIDFDEVLIPPFKLQEEVIDEEEYVPIYILNIKESLDSMLEGLETEMIIDEEHDS